MTKAQALDKAKAIMDQHIANALNEFALSLDRANLTEDETKQVLRMQAQDLCRWRDEQLEGLRTWVARCVQETLN
jgi:hypothetical protein